MYAELISILTFFNFLLFILQLNKLLVLLLAVVLIVVSSIITNLIEFPNMANKGHSS